MSLISFLKDAGEKLWSHKEAPAATATDEASQAKIKDANVTAGAAIAHYIGTQNLKADDLTVAFDGATLMVTVSGVAPDLATKEKIVLCCGNVAGVAGVNDLLTVAEAATTAASTFHTVVRGDTLSAIAKAHYGNANDYPKIFEANRPMLSHPDKIYPGQVLRLPAP